MVAGSQAGERPNIRSGSGAWPRDTYPAHVARLIGTPEASRNFRTSGVVHQSAGSVSASFSVIEYKPTWYSVLHEYNFALYGLANEYNVTLYLITREFA
jgi:hypothetical protein